MDPDVEAKMHREHYLKYDALARRIGIEALKKVVPVDRDRILEALRGRDYYLNTIPLTWWDRARQAHYTFPEDAGKHLGFNPPWTPKVARNLSLAERVCILKHVAVLYIAGGVSCPS